MADNKNQENGFNIKEFSKKSEEFYSQVKSELEAKYKGKYVALDFESKQYWLGETATDALTTAKKAFPDNPNKLFYLLQIGSPATFGIQSITTLIHPYRKYDFARAY